MITSRNNSSDRDSGIWELRIQGLRPQWNFPGGALFHGVKIAKSIEQEQLREG